MNIIGKAFTLVLLATNLIMAFMLLLCSYSHLFNPIKHSILSTFGLAFPGFLIINLLFIVFWLFFYKKYSLISFLTIILCINPICKYIPLNLFREDKPDDSLKILSYNTMALGGGEESENGDNKVLQYIIDSDADIVCLQEFLPIKGLSIKKIDGILKMYKYNNFAIINSSNGLACYSRFPILSSEVIKYESKTNGSIAYKIKVDNDTIIVVNNHLESNKLTKDDKEMYREMILSPDKEKMKFGSKLLLSKLATASMIRAPQADSVKSYIDRHPNNKFIVCGDFNDSPLSYSCYTIRKSLKDAFAESGRGPGTSYNRNHFYFRIDHIFIDPSFESYQCTVDKSIKASDHYPIWCYVDMKRKS